VRLALAVLAAGGVALACAGAREVPEAAGAPAPAAKPVVPPGAARRVCDTDCAARARCDDAAAPAAACACEAVTDTTLLRADWIQTVVACRSRADCPTLDACETEGYRAIGAAPLDWPPVVLQCLERGAECGGSSATCRRFAALMDDARADVARCFQGSCEASASCLRTFLARRVMPAVPAWR
jgi:hypothetical protein